MSTKAAGLAKKMGYENIQVMLKGAPGWKKSGRNLVASNDFVEKGNIILLDVRSRREAAAGHIARAVNIPLAELEDAEDDFPTSKAAPVVIYGVGDQAAKAAKMVKGWGYKSVSLVDDGLIGWMAAGKKLQNGHPATEINWVRKLGKGEVSIEDFQKAAAGQAPDSLIVDVRNSDETTDGMFPGAVNIPLDVIEARMGELPKDKTLLLHCSTGARAEMAHAALKKAGYTSKFLVATIECEDGECEIEE
jgi:rhodanese-related sulfurtransferase